MTTNHLTPAELDALLEAARAAGIEPWRHSKLFRQASDPAHEWIEIDSDERMVCSVDSNYLAADCLDEQDQAIAAFIALANPATITLLVLMVRELENKLQFVTNERNRLLQSSLTTEATQAMQIHELQSDLAEEKRLRAELKQIAQIGIAEVSSVGTALKENAVHDAIEHFRARAVRAIEALEIDTTHDHFYLTGYYRARGDARYRIKSLPLVETEEE